MWECFPSEFLRLFSDYLYRFSSERGTPTLCVSFAIDCGWFVYRERKIRNPRSISKEIYSGQVSATMEGSKPDYGNAVRNRDACQEAAVAEGRRPDGGNAIRDRNSGQAAATPEGITPDAGDRFSFNYRSYN